MLPKRIVKKPARKNLMPAKRICDDVSLPAIFRKLYPILITGNALPHNAQQSIAASATFILLVNIFFILLCINGNTELSKNTLSKSIACRNLSLMTVIVGVTAYFNHNMTLV